MDLSQWFRVRQNPGSGEWAKALVETSSAGASLPRFSVFTESIRGFVAANGTPYEATSVRNMLAE
jgi:hypothetical protein